MKRLGAVFLLFVSFMSAAQQAAAPAPQDENAVVYEVVKKLFAAMAARDALAAKDVFLPDAAIFGVSPNGKATKMPLVDFLDAIGSGKVEWKERIWDAKVLVHGSIAIVWGPYDFHNGGRFSHCGYDSFSLLKTSTGWKISYISDTRETGNCVNPFGPPQ